MHRRPFLALLLTAMGVRSSSSTTVPHQRTGEVDEEPWLREWLNQPVQPVWKSIQITNRPEIEIRNCLLIWESIQRNSKLHLSYHDRLGRGSQRTISPAFAFHKITHSKTPPLYLHAWCHLREAHRIFRLDRIILDSEASAPAPS